MIAWKVSLCSQQSLSLECFSCSLHTGHARCLSQLDAYGFYSALILHASLTVVCLLYYALYMH